MTFQTTAPLTRMNLSAHNTQARGLVESYLDTNFLAADPPYQRGHVWTSGQRVNLIRSMLAGIPIPAIVINDRSNADWVKTYGRGHLATGRDVYGLIDGKQRLATLHMWFAGDLLVPASWFKTNDVHASVETEDGPYVGYLDLDPTVQRYIGMGCTVPLIEAKVGSLAAEADLYLLINGAGTVHTEADLDHAAGYASDM